MITTTRQQLIREMFIEAGSDDEKVKSVLRWIQETSEPFPYVAGVGRETISNTQRAHA